MAEQQNAPEVPIRDGEATTPHPTEPAEGDRAPGSDADAPRPPHPSEPAEGERAADDPRRG